MTDDDLLEPPVPVLTAPHHTPEREALQKQAREFATTRVLPVADELDPRKGEIPRDLLDEMGELGYFGITVGTEHGGLGLGAFEYCMVAEELARAWMSVGSIIARAQGAGTNVADPARRAELLRRSARGGWIGAIALSEPDAGSDLAAVETRAVRDGDEYVVTGRKRWTGNAKAADFVQVLVRTADPEPGEKRSAGLAIVVVEKQRDTFPDGLTGTPIDKIGYHGFVTWDLEFDGLRVPVANQLGAGGEGFADAQAWLNIARVHTAARAVGLARAAVEDCVRYLQRRRQFEHPIGDFQAVRFTLATMAARVEQARSFYQHVAHRLDQGESCEREAAMAKLVATEMAAEVTADGIQLHGGNGYTTEHQVERHWRDARLTTIFEGTSEIQKKIIADRLLPRSPLG
ncbi:MULTISPECIES: acyl-CoA dehydrogenase family protein [unclassified Pseudonocardia]|uniref:acyl-CoA dehydrogenase family protein n=1 Tax=unclassified Pseudonocardia TaxID=2619320 RepID=UPI00094AE26D|nr:MULTISPECIES: acyl-CoA dehydrogenase family protein [unclassified Pseudonocardia]OLL71910.1 isobutyryl-CoA dehydrogenase [Pseudonocardia sp. Ae150A_Ps1]OLL88000.1 isobutyryl-CoA dehydrogenase [Pseudonocardia sp. Ae263_Ps1]OLL91975.1 isobutyryl-CoA dehydrogenase [Pseudonocardia sp. Ae356_Ps1]